MRLLGAVLVAVGILLLIYGGITLFVPRDVIDLGAVSITIHENLVIPLPPIFGAISLIIGVILLSRPVVLPPPPPHEPY